MSLKPSGWGSKKAPKKGRVEPVLFLLGALGILGAGFLIFRVMPRADREEYRRIVEKESSDPNEVLFQALACQQFLKRFPDSAHGSSVERFKEKYHHQLSEEAAFKCLEVQEILPRIERGEISPEKLGTAHRLITNLQNQFKDLDPPIRFEDTLMAIESLGLRFIRKWKEEEPALFLSRDFWTLRKRLDTAKEWKIEPLNSPIGEWEAEQQRQFEVVLKQVLAQAKIYADAGQFDKAIQLIEAYQAERHPAAETDLEKERQCLLQEKTQCEVKDKDLRRKTHDFWVEKARATQTIQEKIDCLQKALEAQEDPETRKELNRRIAEDPERITKFNACLEEARKRMDEKNWTSAERTLDRAEKLAGQASSSQVAEEMKVVNSLKQLLDKRKKDQKLEEEKSASEKKTNRPGTPSP